MKVKNSQEDVARRVRKDKDLSLRTEAVAAKSVGSIKAEGKGSKKRPTLKGSLLRVVLKGKSLRAVAKRKVEARRSGQY